MRSTKQHPPRLDSVSRHEGSPEPKEFAQPTRFVTPVIYSQVVKRTIIPARWWNCGERCSMCAVRTGCSGGSRDADVAAAVQAGHPLPRLGVGRG
ncbi:predicted protein [Streptomyces viridosporus ATCC 14672]|uniref:Predicted protein n=1 Tax=Streptomyces viridosporus (strain ATCC 14672 / DSM 40746 / JCM 4963 / KCTC 9882 / NRRL B-12104 / FH 1290) TaxID=566461 RepID=D6A774_STRV1|nr:predicted protein [Streptomyces viridosporus ATCC 14672]